MAFTYGNITLSTGAVGAAYPTGSVTLSSPTNTTNWASTYSINPVKQYPASVELNEKGIQLTAEADLVIGGQSIKKTLEAIESRLAILRPATELEAEWAELKRLGDEYRSLEKEIREKMKTWDTLKNKDL